MLGVDNDLHEALLKKDNTTFWRCWRSKLECLLVLMDKCQQVDGCVDDNIIVNTFAAYFKDLFRCNNVNRDGILRQDYLSARSNYCGLQLMDSHKIDTELVSNVIANLKRGRAIDVDGLSAEHLQYSHPSLRAVLSKLF